MNWRGAQWLLAVGLLTTCGEADNSMRASDADTVASFDADDASRAVLDAVLGAVFDPESDTEPGAMAAGDRYDQVVFGATHNSYAGGARGSLRAQLDAGIRFVELDVHDNGYTDFADFRVGHLFPGNNVQTGGDNPPSDALADWLEVIAAWSGEHPDHAPITLGLDLKDNLTDNRDFGQGNLAALNARLVEAFGTTLLPAEAIGDVWPRVDAIRGRVIAVLSGHEGTRVAYRRDRGASPAVSLDAHGRIVEVHDSGRGHLWSWTGARDDEGDVVWHRHGRYDTGRAPAVAIADDGWLVEVHQGAVGDALWYRVGRVDAALEIEWSHSAPLGRGERPTVIIADDAWVVRFEADGAIWDRTGHLDAVAMAIDWSPPARTDAAPFERSRSVSGSDWIEVSNGGDRWAPADTLRYRTPVADGRITYPQLAFVETQPDDFTMPRDDEGLRDEGLWFVAASADDPESASAWRAAGFVVRQWGLDDPTDASTPRPSFPATDTPSADWYRAFLVDTGALAICGMLAPSLD